MPRSRKAPVPASSSLARGVAASHAGDTDAERAEHIARLRQQIKDGTYAPDPYEIARKILDEGL